MILAGTGHRPDKLGGYSDEVNAKLYGLACRLLNDLKPEQVISGMALGWDQALAKAAIVLGYPCVAAIPFRGQESLWPAESKRMYQELLMRCTEVVCTSNDADGGYAPYKMQLRNQWMIDHCTNVAALWNGSPGGTGSCIAYAKRVGRPIRNLWPEWVRI